MALVKITDSVTTTSSDIAASATAVNTLYNMINDSSGKLVYTEIKRFTSSGTFNSSSFPSVGYVYDVIIQGGGGSGGTVGNYTANAKAYPGGSSGVSVCLGGVYIRPGVDHVVTVGAGGTAVTVSASYNSSVGRNGSDTSFLGFVAPGGAGGTTTSTGGDGPTPQTVGIFSNQVGTAGLKKDGGKGGDSILAAGGANGSSKTSGGTSGTLGSGGGSGAATYPSGAGGDGVVIIYGLVES